MDKMFEYEHTFGSSRPQPILNFLIHNIFFLWQSETSVRLYLNTSSTTANEHKEDVMTSTKPRCHLHQCPSTRQWQMAYLIPSYGLNLRTAVFSSSQLLLLYHMLLMLLAICSKFRWHTVHAQQGGCTTTFTPVVYNASISSWYFASKLDYIVKCVQKKVNQN